jgi:predicted transcriptional regulator YheO
MSVRPELKVYIPIVKFLAEVFGSNTEVVLHDVTNLDSSIVAIENGYISGRKVGDPVTNLVLKIIREKQYLDKDYIANYSAYSPSKKNFRSSSFFIKGKDNKLIGMLCINSDASFHIQMKEYLDEYCSFMLNKETNNLNDMRENLQGNAQDALKSMIAEIIGGIDIQPKRMTQDEKINIVEKMYINGVFLLKGSIAEAAKALDVTEPTIYRYLSKVKKNDNENKENGF